MHVDRWHGAGTGRPVPPLALAQALETTRSVLGHAIRSRAAVVAALASPYAPRRPTETALYALVREHLETFVSWARETYEKPLPRYVEQELRAYLKCGVFAHGFVRCRCDACGHELLVAFSCKGRGVCPSCAGRRMANTAAHLVDRVLPVLPVRQWVLSLPWELRRFAAFKADVLGALARVFVEAIFARYRAAAKDGDASGRACGAVTFVQRFGGSLNLNVHFHVVVVDGVFTRDGAGRVRFCEAPPPITTDLDGVARHVKSRIVAWLRRRGYLDERPLEERGDGAPEPTAMDACAAIAMHRGTFARLTADDPGTPDDDTAAPRSHASAARDGFDVHAGVRIEGADTLGRERLCRYGARPALALDRLRRMRDGRVSYRVKYARRGRSDCRVMTPVECLARLSALVPPPRLPLVRYHGVLGPRSSWRKDVVPTGPPAARGACGATEPCGQRADGADGEAAAEERDGDAAVATRPEAAPPSGSATKPPSGARATAPWLSDADIQTQAVASAACHETSDTRGMVGRVMLVAPATIALDASKPTLARTLARATSRIDWATLLRRTFEVDVLECARCHGRLRVLGAVTVPAEARAILERLGFDTEAPPAARARDPTEFDDVA